MSDCASPANIDCGLDNAIDAFNADSIDDDADTIVVGDSPSPFISEDTPIDNPTPGITLSISGGGASESLISEGTQVTDFTIDGGVTNVSNLTIENGEQEAAFGGAIDDESGDLTVTDDVFLNNSVVLGGLGGAIACNNGELTATNDAFTNNVVHNGYGGALAGLTCTLTADNDTFTDNTAPQGAGGAVVNLGGTLALTDDLFSDNSDSNGGGGGAVFDSGGLGVTTISGDSFLDNAGGGGGAIAIYDSALNSSGNTYAGDTTIGGGGGGAIWDLGGAVTSTNDTFANDTATFTEGGAIMFSSGTLDATDDTFSNDSAISGGGGIDSAAPGATMSDSILDAAGCDGVVTDGGYNVESDDSCGFGSSDVINSPSINLSGTLAANNSSAPETLSIGPGSSAFEEVPAGDCAIATDERSLPRPGEPAQSSCDAGAYEYQYAPAVLQRAFQSISFHSLPSVVIGTTPFALTASTTSGLPVSFASTSPSVCATSGTIVRLLATGTCSISASQAGNSRYLPADSVDQSFPVTKAPLMRPTRPLIRATSPFNGRLRIAFVARARGATQYQYSLDDGAWRRLADRGSLVISGLDSRVTSVRVRGLNAAGPGPASRAARTTIRF